MLSNKKPQFQKVPCRFDGCNEFDCIANYCEKHSFLRDTTPKAQGEKITSEERLKTDFFNKFHLSLWSDNDSLAVEMNEKVWSFLQDALRERDRQIEKLLFTENGFLREDDNLASDILTLLKEDK